MYNIAAKPVILASWKILAQISDRNGDLLHFCYILLYLYYISPVDRCV